MTPEIDGSPLRGSPSIRPADPTPRKQWKRALYLTLAIVSIGLAIAGVFIPGLPSTEFVLLASWAAARSSSRLHRWLHEHKWFGPILHNWYDGRRIARRAKTMATISMSVCMVVMAHTIPHDWVVWPLCVTMAAVLIWIWRRPEPNPAGVHQPIYKDRTGPSCPVRR